MGFTDIKREFIQGVRVTTLTCQKNHLEKCKRLGLASKEVVSRAKINLGARRIENNNVRGLRKETNRLLNLQIVEKKRTIRAEEKKWWSMRKAEDARLVPPARQKLNQIRHIELNRIWENLVKDLSQKLENLKPRVPDHVGGVPLDDETLKNTFGETVVTPIILGGIQASENVKAFLKLPLKVRTYPKAEKKEFKTQAEARSTRSRWRIRGRKVHSGETLQEERTRVEQEEDFRAPVQGNRVRFSHLRVTDFEANKMIHMPQPASNREEIMIGAEQIQLLDAWDLYVDKNCSDNGTQIGAQNLTRAEELGRKEIQEGVESRGWILYGTDKSGKLVLDLRENFNKCMEPHYINEIPVTIDQVHESEKSLNILNLTPQMKIL